MALAGWHGAVALFPMLWEGTEYQPPLIEDDDGSCIGVPEEYSHLRPCRFLPDRQILFCSQRPVTLYWFNVVDDRLSLARTLDVSDIRVASDGTPFSLAGNRWEMDADGAIWLASGLEDGSMALCRITDHVEYISFPKGLYWGGTVCIDKDGRKVMPLEREGASVEPCIGLYVDGGPASQRLTLSAYLDGQEERDLVVEAEVVNCALAAAWLNAYFVAEYDGQLYYAPHWSPDPLSQLPHWVKAGSGSRQSGEILRILVNQLPSGHYKFYGGMTFRDRPMNELIGSASEKIAVAEIEIP